MSRGGGIPAEALLDLRRRLDALSPRDRGRRALVEGTAELFGVSRATVYRALAGHPRARRPDARRGVGAVTWSARSHVLGSSLSNVSPSRAI